MKASEFRKLIREEVRKVLAESVAKFKIGQEVEDINGDETFEVGEVYSNLQAALSDLKTKVNAKVYKKIIADISDMYSSYNPIKKSDDNKPWYILEPTESERSYPYLSPQARISIAGNRSGSDSDVHILKPTKLNPNKVYVVDIVAQGISTPIVDAVIETDYSNPKSVASNHKSSGDKVITLSDNTYIAYSNMSMVSRETWTVIGSPTSTKYKDFWKAIAKGDEDTAIEIFNNTMKK